ncbi:peptidyl-prolyl cis-trans isomerase FKBP43-like isoform X2 [Phoenix dactylifera]|uniref:peptidylprolyl isomerase n=1 Tax=Phoenix dactylifera TaxID=42345 RepID=A0A8B8ZV68_PHODC|nr:peptidyl-prolyl cis-trans isomerase FKBP43-like isoform X2 [Phoenix dactylifera]
MARGKEMDRRDFFTTRRRSDRLHPIAKGRSRSPSPSPSPFRAMAFWGVEVKPGNHYMHLLNDFQGRLRICQATLGSGSAVTKSVLQCIVGNRSLILLCSLIPNVVETCHLELEFEEDGKVIFSVLGERSVHLSGYFLRPKILMGGDESDSYGEDIGEEDSSSYDKYDSAEDKYESDFIDDGDLQTVPPSPKYKSSVVIKEIVGKDKPGNGNASWRCLKREHVVSDTDDSNDDFRCQPVVKSKSSMELENEEEDGFPISFFPKKKIAAKTADGNCKLGDSVVYGILESEEEDGNAKPAEGYSETGAAAVDEEKKWKINAISEDLESARVTFQPCDSSLLPSEMSFENNGFPKKKKKVKDRKPLEMISNGERVRGDTEKDRDDAEVGMAKMDTKEKDFLVGAHVDMAEKDEKLKKKKHDGAKKRKACQMHTDFLTEGTEKGEERNPNELINREVMDEVLPVGSNELPNNKDENSRKKKKKNKQKGGNVDEGLTVLDKVEDDNAAAAANVSPQEAKQKKEKSKNPKKGNMATILTVEELATGKCDGSRASP